MIVLNDFFSGLACNILFLGLLPFLVAVERKCLISHKCLTNLTALNQLLPPISFTCRWERAEVVQLASVAADIFYGSEGVPLSVTHASLV